MKRNFIDGVQEGKWMEYFKTGVLKKEENFVDGKKHGKELIYF